MEIRKREPLQAFFEIFLDKRLDCILMIGLMYLQMAGKQGNRIKQLLMHTAVAMYHTCKGLVAFTIILLQNYGYEHVCLGKLIQLIL